MERPSALSDADLAAFLHRAPQWSVIDGQLTRSVSAPTFPQAIAWVNAIAEVAEQMNHHPDIDIRWRTLTFRLATHDVGALTELDTRLAAAIDEIAAPTLPG